MHYKSSFLLCGRNLKLETGNSKNKRSINILRNFKYPVSSVTIHDFCDFPYVYVHRTVPDTAATA